MKLSGSVYFAFSALAVLQISWARSPQNMQRAKVTTTSTTMETCKDKPAPLVTAQNHCKKIHSHTMDKKDTNSTDMVTAMNHTKSDMLAQCYPLCILKTLNMLDSNMVPIENRLKTMMTRVSLITDPKSTAKMSDLMDACLSQYKQMTMDHEHVQEEDHSCMAMGHAHKNDSDKCAGAAHLIGCMNKGLPCPFFDDIKM